MRVMVTNGGPHPADKWAETTTDAILDLIQIEDDADTPQAAMARQAKRDLRPVLFNIFMGHHDGVQKRERGELKSKRTSQVTARIDPTPHFEGGVIAKVEQALAATPFAAHFAQAHVHAVIHQIIGQHTANSMDIERKWHADKLAKG